MKYNVYYGNENELSKQECLGSFEAMESAEAFLLNYINGKNTRNEDINKNIISETKWQYGSGHDDKIYTIIKSIEVVAAVIFKGDKIFATQRGYGEFKDGWEFPGGKMEVGESREDALKRELREELNVKIKVESLIKTVEYDYPNFHLNMHSFKSKLKKGEPELLEHEAARWVSKGEIDNIAWLPADVEIIEQVKNILR